MFYPTNKMKTKENLFISGLLLFLLFASWNVTAQGVPTRDLTLTGAPNQGNYSGYGINGTFGITFVNVQGTNPTDLDSLPANSIKIILVVPPGLEFAEQYPGIPEGWRYERDEQPTTARLFQESPVSNIPPASFISFSVPFLVVGPVDEGLWSAQINRQALTFLDNNNSNDQPNGVLSVANVLPVKLSSFKALEKEGLAHTTWTTTEEVSFDHFEIQRSFNGKSDFATVGKVSARGVSGKGASYGFTDQDAPKGQLLYYRLKMVDKDGTSELSHIESLELSGASVSVYPNPASSFVKVTANEAIRSLELINLAGQGMNKTRYAGDRKVETLELRNAPSGVYQVKVEGVSGSTVFRKLMIGE